MIREILVNIISGHGLLPDGTMPLPDPMLIHHEYGPVTFICTKFHNKLTKSNLLECFYPSALRAGGVLSSRFGRTVGRAKLAEPISL